MDPMYLTSFHMYLEASHGKPVQILGLKGRGALCISSGITTPSPAKRCNTRFGLPASSPEAQKELATENDASKICQKP